MHLLKIEAELRQHQARKWHDKAVQHAANGNDLAACMCQSNAARYYKLARRAACSQQLIKQSACTVLALCCTWCINNEGRRMQT